MAGTPIKRFLNLVVTIIPHFYGGPEIKMGGSFCGFKRPRSLWYNKKMKASRYSHLFRFVKAQAIIIWAVAGIVLFASELLADDNLLELSTRSLVSSDGKVTIALTLKNPGRQPLFHVHPMFHFHHTMSPMTMIHRLDPGQSITLENTKHPPVGMVGSYPVVAMVSYKETEQSKESRTSIHTDSFYYEEPKVSLIEGNLGVQADESSSLVRILLKNPSSSFKNVRMILLLPPELISERFQGIMGFTLRGGEEKYFDVPVRKVSGLAGGVYPVHLLVEYGELLRHYSGDIRGEINFGPVIVQGAFWPQLLVFAFLAVTLWLVFYRKFTSLKSA